MHACAEGDAFAGVHVLNRRQWRQRQVRSVCAALSLVSVRYTVILAAVCARFGMRQWEIMSRLRLIQGQVAVIISQRVLPELLGKSVE